MVMWFMNYIKGQDQVGLFGADIHQKPCSARPYGRHCIYPGGKRMKGAMSARVGLHLIDVCALQKNYPTT